MSRTDIGAGAQDGGTVGASSREPLGPALVQWNDYVGTAAADDFGAADGGRSFYELTGLDPVRWAVVAVDLLISADSDRIVVYAVDRSSLGVQTHAEMLELAYRSGELPVTAFEVGDDLSVRDILLTAFKQMAVRLTSRGISDQRLAVAHSAHLSTGSTDTPTR